MEQRQRSVVLIYGEQTTGLTVRVPPTKKEEIRARFYALLKEYESPTTVMVDCFGLGDSKNIDKSITMADIDEISKKLDDSGKNNTTIINSKTGEYLIKNGIIPTSHKQVSSLPKDRKLITEGGYKGLYSGDEKWYTNKVIDNQLLILEWDSLESAKGYLDSLNK